jgi:hypothetical protein
VGDAAEAGAAFVVPSTIYQGTRDFYVDEHLVFGAWVVAPWETE